MTNIQKALYTEDGAEAIVEIVQDLSDKEYERYKLKIVDVLKTAWHGMSFEVGEEFEVCHNKKYGRQAGCWSLEPM